MNRTNLATKLKANLNAPFGKDDYALALVLSLITLILCVGQVNDGHNWGGDFSGYIAQAIALANGEVAQYIADNMLMMTKCDWLYGPYAYPWGFPALLAITYKIFGFNIVAFKFVNIICYALFVGIFYIFCAIRLPRIYALFATLFFALNPAMVAFVANNVLSDMPFLLFGFIALIILAKLFGESPRNNKKDIDCHENTAYFLAMTGRVDSSLRGSVSKANTTKQSMNKIIDYFNFLRKSRNNKKSIKSYFATLTNQIDCHDLPKTSLAMTGWADSSLRGEAEAIHYSNNGILIAIFGGIFMLFATTIRINGFVILCALLTMHGILLAKRFAPNLFTAKILKPFLHIDSPYSWKIHAIPYIIFIIGFAIVSITLSSGGSGHWQHLININLQSVFYNFDFYIYAIATFKDFLMIDIMLKPIVFILSVILYCFALRSILNDNRFAENVFYIIFSLGFFILLIIWIDIAWLRFAYLLLPFLVFGCAKGLAYLNANNKIFGRIISIILFALLANSTYNHLVGNNHIPNEAYTKEAKEIWDFIDKSTPKNAVILFHKPRVLYLNAHRISFASNNIARLNEVDFVLWERDLWRSYSGINIDSSAFKERTELIYQNAQFKLYKVIQ